MGSDPITSAGEAEAARQLFDQLGRAHLVEQVVELVDPGDLREAPEDVGGLRGAADAQQLEQMLLTVLVETLVELLPDLERRWLVQRPDAHGRRLRAGAIEDRVDRAAAGLGRTFHP